MVKSKDEIGAIVVRNVNGKPLLIRDIAEVRFGYANRFGAITANGEGEKVLGQIMMLKDADLKKVIDEVKKTSGRSSKKPARRNFYQPHPRKK